MLILGMVHNCALLALALLGTARAEYMKPFRREDRIATVFTVRGNRLHALASGDVRLRPARAAIVPLMLYRRAPLLACAVIAARPADQPLPAAVLAE